MMENLKFFLRPRKLINIFYSWNFSSETRIDLIRRDNATVS